MQTISYILAVLAGGTTFGLTIMLISLKEGFKHAPKLNVLHSNQKVPPDTALTVVIPAYNESSNIEKCITCLLKSKSPSKKWKILLIDDCSTDNTVQLANNIGEQLSIPRERFEVINAGPRPKGERWVGKNWACTIAMEKVNTPWVLFIDADVRVKPDTLERALSQAIHEQADLLSLAPKITCSCIAEWLVQPIMAFLLGLGFPIKATNDPKDPKAFAAGPFMLFRKSTYEAIGGHKSIATEVVEDIALANKVKSSGYKLLFLLGLDSIKLGMYSNLAELWEGWTKNWFLGLNRNITRSIGGSIFVLWIFTLPWLLIPGILVVMNTSAGESICLTIALGLTSISLILQFLLRYWALKNFQLPIKYWWLMWLGGIIVALIGPSSMWRTITGKGWTWKGRSLS